MAYRLLAVCRVSIHHDIAVYIELMWGGYKRWIGVSLNYPLQNRYHWNWFDESSRLRNEGAFRLAGALPFALFGESSRGPLDSMVRVCLPRLITV